MFLLTSTYRYKFKHKGDTYIIVENFHKTNFKGIRVFKKLKTRYTEIFYDSAENSLKLAVEGVLNSKKDLIELTEHESTYFENEMKKYRKNALNVAKEIVKKSNGKIKALDSIAGIDYIVMSNKSLPFDNLYKIRLSNKGASQKVFSLEKENDLLVAVHYLSNTANISSKTKFIRLSPERFDFVAYKEINLEKKKATLLLYLSMDSIYLKDYAMYLLDRKPNGLLDNIENYDLKPYHLKTIDKEAKEMSSKLVKDLKKSINDYMLKNNQSSTNPIN